jgi:hypothetical protein
MRFHVLAIPYTATHEMYSACAYTQKVLKFCKMMHTRGHIIYHYGHERSEVLCTEHITVTDDTILAKAYPDYDYRKSTFKPNSADFAHTEFIKNTIPEITKRKEPRDILCYSGVKDMHRSPKHIKTLSQSNQALVILINLVQVLRPLKVIRLCILSIGKHGMQPRWMDAVVPLFFDPKDAEPLERLPGPSALHTSINALPKGFVLFLGRIRRS